MTVTNSKGFPGRSAGKESVCNAGDPGLIPGSGRSPGEGLGYSLPYSWVSLAAQLVKNPPAMRETWVRSWCWEDMLEKEMSTHSTILVWRIPWTVQSMGSQRGGQKTTVSISSVQFSHSVMSDSLQPNESKHTSPPCPSPSPGVHSDSRPSSQ